MRFPQTLVAAISLARLKEHTIETIAKKTRPTFKLTISQPPSVSYSSTNTKPYKPQLHPKSGQPPNQMFQAGTSNSIIKTTTSPITPVLKMTPTEMKAKRDKGLCFYCDEPYHKAYKCKGKQLYLLIGGKKMTR